MVLKIGLNMKRISLTKNKFALISDKDYKFLSNWTWYASRSRKMFYACRDATIEEIKLGSPHTIKMHKIVRRQS